MASFNQVILIGNLTRDPQVKFLPSQTQVAEFGVACNRKYKLQSGEEREEVTFVDCSAFGKTAELIGKFFTKGKPIFIQGRLKYDSWEDKNGGGKRSKLTVQVENFQFVGGRDGPGQGEGGGYASGAYDEGGEGGGGGGGYQRPAQRGPQRPAGQGAPAPQRGPAPQQPFGEEEQFKDDDIPF